MRRSLYSRGIAPKHDTYVEFNATELRKLIEEGILMRDEFVNTILRASFTEADADGNLFVLPKRESSRKKVPALKK